MVVDDSTSVRKSLERVLEIHGFSMQGVASAAEALRQAGVRRPDLVLSEVNLPDLSGLELCRRLSLAGLPVLLMSQESGSQARELSRAAGALELLGKPLDQQT
ncbi:MAG: response regulator, partial [Deinococcus sp.]